MERRLIVEEHLEKYKFIAEYNLEYQAQEALEEREGQLAAEQHEMDHRMMQAEKERDLALESLEHLRTQQPCAVPANRHLAARPK